MTTPARGLTLFDAARAMGVPFTKETNPQDKEITVNGFKFHYLDWGNENAPVMLLLHGRTNSAHTWDFTALAFHERFNVIWCARHCCNFFFFAVIYNILKIALTKFYIL